MKKILVAGAVVVAIAGLAACNGDKRSADRQERAVTDRIQKRIVGNQPPPERPYSQLRQNLIEIEEAQMDSVQTTSFFFTRGRSDGAPVWECPSIGFPIASTAQLSNPLKPAGRDDNATIAQIEPNGIFTGDSTATYVICINGKGKTFATYWEGDVMAFTGPAAYNPDTQQLELVGEPTAHFSSAKSGK